MNRREEVLEILKTVGAPDKELLLGEKVNASLGNILYALKHLTPVEFRFWLEHCKTYPDFDPTHFEGLEEYFIKTGKWEFRAEEKIA